MTTTTTASELADGIHAQLDPLLASLEGQVLVSQNRWVDHMLDLYNSVELPPLRQVVESTLAQMRFRGAVETRWVREQLQLLAGAVAVESAFDATAALIR